MKMQKKDSYYRQAFEKLKEHPLAMVGLIVCLAELVLVVFLPIIMHLDPYTVDRANFGTPPGVGGHILGTDTIGRDVFARLVYGGRVSLFVGFFSTAVSILIGVPLGLAAGYVRGIVEIIIMRITDIFMSFPAIVLILVAVAVIGPSLWSVSIIIGILGWTQFARIVYAKVLSVSQEDYIEAANAIGSGKFTIIWRYILPNSVAPILIAATFGMASAILMESSLSFLGMGVQPPTASWGNMIYEAQSIAILVMKPWMWVPAGIAILITVLGINFLGDGIRDALDPKVNI
jgi:peptide/nickel transport system permease protein